MTATKTTPAPKRASRAASGITSAALLVAGTTPVGAQVPESPPPDQTGVQVVPGEAVDPGPAAEQSGWLDIGVWGIAVLVVLVVLAAWFFFFRPKSPRPRR